MQISDSLLSGVGDGLAIPLLSLFHIPRSRRGPSCYAADLQKELLPGLFDHQIAQFPVSEHGGLESRVRMNSLADCPYSFGEGRALKCVKQRFLIFPRGALDAINSTAILVQLDSNP